MACQFQVFVNAGQYENAAEIAVQALNEVDAIESILTVYREDSETSEVNRTAYERRVEVGSHVREILSMSLRLHEATHGAFDVTAGPLSDAWGFARRAGRVPSDAELSAALAKVGSRRLLFDEHNDTVGFARKGMKLNFGGIGKGYALDRCANVLQEAGVNDFMFHGGKSSVLGRGKWREGTPDKSCWTVGLIHPQRPERRLAEVRIRDRALSTSGSQAQSFHHRGQRYGHIIDPRNGQPAEGVLSATVMVESAAEADALSTALFVLGRDEAVKFCREHPEVSAILVLPGDNTGSPQIETYNLNDDDWQLIEPVHT
jgi:thiamine biosynthesis lipoprotein